MSSDHLYSAASDIAETLRHLREAGRYMQRAVRNITVEPSLPEGIDPAMQSDIYNAHYSHRELLHAVNTRMQEDIRTLQEEHLLLSQFSGHVRLFEQQAGRSSHEK